MSSGSTVGSGPSAGCCPPSRPPSPRGGAGWSSPEANAAEARAGARCARSSARRAWPRSPPALRRDRRRRPTCHRCRPEAVPRARARRAGPRRRGRPGRTRAPASRSPPRAGTTCCMVGPPGTGKTMLAARLPGLLPDLSEADAVEVTAVHSVAGAFDPGGGLLRRPPFEDPHHTATPASVVGGGSGVPRPGAASRAHRGVLFLDEAPEFSTAVLQTAAAAARARRAGAPPGARAPPATRRGSSWSSRPTRARAGRRSARGWRARAAREQRRRYFGKLSGPLLDRVDLQVELSPVAGGRGRRGSPRRSSPRGCSPLAPPRRERLAGHAVAHQRRRPGQLAAGAARTRPLAGRGPRPRARPRHAEPARGGPRAARRVDAGRPGRPGGARAGRRRAGPAAADARARRMTRATARRCWRARPWSAPGRSRGTLSPGRSWGCSAPRTHCLGPRGRRGADAGPRPLAEPAGSLGRRRADGGSLQALAAGPSGCPTATRAAISGGSTGSAAPCWSPEILGGRAALDDLGVEAPFCLWVRGDLGPGAPSRRVRRGRRVARGDVLRRARRVRPGRRARRGRRVRGVRRRVRHRRGRAPRCASPRGGPTVVVLAGGVDRAYPAGNARLLDAVVGGGGALVSEVPPGSLPTKSRFLQRNRLIAAAGRATVVVEAAWRSGAMSTAHHAARLLRPVGAVPGPGHVDGVRGLPPAAAGRGRGLRHGRGRGARARGRRSAPAWSRRWRPRAAADARAARPQDAPRPVSPGASSTPCRGACRPSSTAWRALAGVYGGRGAGRAGPPGARRVGGPPRRRVGRRESSRTMTRRPCPEGAPRTAVKKKGVR